MPNANSNFQEQFSLVKDAMFIFQIFPLGVFETFEIWFAKRAGKR